MITRDAVDLDPAVLAWISRLEELESDNPASEPGKLPAVRERAERISNALAKQFTLPVPDGVEIEQTTVALPGRNIEVRSYRRRGQLDAPTQVRLHGGGFSTGTTREAVNDRLSARLALESGIQILSIEYRLAPENTYPDAADDAREIIEAVHLDPARFHADPMRIGIGGNSAGAAIAASAVLRARDDGGPVIAHQDLEVPAVTIQPSGRSWEDYSQGFGLEGIAELATIYLGERGNYDGNASPLEVRDLAGLPPTLILVAEFDPLRDSGVAYAHRLRDAGVPVDLYIGEGQLHGTSSLTRTFENSRRWQHAHSHLLAQAYDSTPLL